MSTRLATILGIAEGDRGDAPSAEVVRIREPTAGAEIRTKGALYLLAEVPADDRRARRVAKDALAAVERDYYYDLTAGVPVTLRSAVARGSRQLRRRLRDPGAAVGVAAVALHGREAHVVRAGTPSAIVVRDGRMYEAARRRTDETRRGVERDPELVEWHGELCAGDRVALVGRGLGTRVGAGELRRALMTHCPQAAVERVREAHVAAGGSRHDGIVAIEVIEVPATEPVVALEPVASDADADDAGPRPPRIAMEAAAALVHRTAAAARRPVGRAVAAVVATIMAVVPRRAAAYPTGTPRTAQRRTARRVRLGAAGLAGVAVLGWLGAATTSAPSARPGDAIERTALAHAALADATLLLAGLDERVAGADLVTRDPDAARQALGAAGAALDAAVRAGIDRMEVLPLTARVTSGLDRLDGVTRLSSATVVADLGPPGTAGSTPADMVAASDGSLWVLDTARGRVLRVDPATRDVAVAYRSGDVTTGGEVLGDPWAIATAATDVVVIDADGRAWRVDLADRRPHAMIVAQVDVLAAADGPPLITAVQHQPPLQTFAIYGVVRSTGEVLRWVPPPVLPVSFPNAPELYLAGPPDIDPRHARDLLVDTSGWLLHDDTVTRVEHGTPMGQAAYALEPPPDGDRPDYRFIDAATVRGRETLFVYDAASRGILAFDRADGAFIGQWRSAPGTDAEAALHDVQGLVVAAADRSAAIAYVLTAGGVVRLTLD